MFKLSFNLVFLFLFLFLSIKNIKKIFTPGTISAFPSSRHSMTFWLIWSRTSDLISPISPENKAKKP